MSQSKLWAVEAARGVAALLVVLVHASSMLGAPKYLGELPLGGIFKFAHAGVDFFFVLSGFIIYFVHKADIGQPSKTRGYALRRIIRIFPAYWCVLAIYGLMLWWSPTATRFEQQPSAILAALLLLPHPDGAILGPAWSLSHELLFYLLFAVLLWHRRLGVAVLALWGGLTLLNQCVDLGIEAYWWDTFLFRVFNLHFFFGMLVAWLCSRHEHRAAGWAFIAGVLVFFGAGMVESFGPPLPNEWVPMHLAYATGSALALYGLVGLEHQQRVKVPAAMVYLGQASYSVYLVHIPVILVWQQVLLKMPTLLHSPGALGFWSTVAVALIASFLFHQMIELPLGQWTRRRVLRA